MAAPRTRTKTFSHTISGLLAKRADLLGEAVEVRARLACIRADVAAMDRALNALGYAGDLSALQPRRKRVAVFGRGELTRVLLDVLREAERPLLTREITLAILRRINRPAPDEGSLADLARRTGGALRTLESEGVVRAGTNARGRLTWALTAV